MTGCSIVNMIGRRPRWRPSNKVYRLDWGTELIPLLFDHCQRNQADDLVPLCKYFHVFISLKTINSLITNWIMRIIWNFQSITKFDNWLATPACFKLLLSRIQFAPNTILTMKLTLFSKADLQVKIAEEQSRNDGIRGIVVSMDNGDGVFHFKLVWILFYKL